MSKKTDSRTAPAPGKEPAQSRKPKDAQPKPDPRRMLDIRAAGDGYRDGEKQPQALARVVAQGTPMNAALVLDATYQRFPEADLTSMVGALWSHSKATAQGDLSGTEKLLAEQSVALNALWTELARMGLLNINSGRMAAGEVMLRLGLKCQAQATRAAEALATLKHGPAVFAKQATVQNNVAHQQVVQNGAPAENRIQQNELGAQPHELPANRSAPCLVARADTAAPAMAEINRAAHGAGQAGQQQKRLQRRAPPDVA